MSGLNKVSAATVFGISHQLLSNSGTSSVENLKSCLITCHLGGCSLAAIRDGHSVDTTMGFTPLESLMMGSRSGSIGILIHLMRQEGYTADKLELLNKTSGRVSQGIRGYAPDYGGARRRQPRAKLALVFVHRLRSSIGAMLASLGIALVFTAGNRRKLCD